MRKSQSFWLMWIVSSAVHRVSRCRIAASPILGSNTCPRHTKWCIIELCLAWAIEGGVHIVPPAINLLSVSIMIVLVLNWVQIGCLPIVRKEVILDNYCLAYVLSSSLSGSLSSIVDFNVTSLSSSTLKISVIICFILVPWQIISGRRANAVNVLRILLAHSYQILDF